MKVIAIIGKAGSGKDTLLRHLIEKYPNRLHVIVSSTTRPKRQGEIEDKDYHYLDINDFAAKVINDQFLEYTSFNNWYYGITKDELRNDQTNVGVFSPQGVRNLKQKGIEVKVVYLRAAAKERLMRQLNREMDPDVKEIIRRFGTDEKDFEDLSDLDYIEINNTKPEDMVKAIETLGKFI